MTAALDHDASHRPWVYGVLIAVAAGGVTANVFNAEPLQGANDKSRWCTVESLLEHGSYVIDDIDADGRWTTIDKVRHEGHFYSTKPPLLPTLVAGVTWVVENVGGSDLREDTRDVVPWVLVVVNVVPLVLALVAVAWFVEQYAARDFTRYLVLATAAFGTLLVPFTASLNNHIVAACSVTLCLALAARILVDGDRSPWTFAGCGFLAMFTCTNELPAAAFGVAIFILLHLRDARRTWLWFVPAAIVPLVAYLGLNLLVTGGLKPFYAYYGTEKYLFVHEGVPSYWSNPVGIDANRDSPPMYLLHCTIGHHGIWSLSPVFLVTLLSWVLLVRWRGERLAIFGGLGAGLTAVVLGFYLSRTQNYNYGGVTAGLRWTIWLIPFWLIAMIPVLDRFTGRWFRGVTIGLLAVSTFSAWYNARTPWGQPWLFDVLERAELIDYDDPPPELDAPLRTWFGSIPDEPASITFESIDTNGDPQHLLLSTDGSTRDGRRTIRVVSSAGNETYSIDAAALRTGTALGDVVDPANHDGLTLLRGLPAEVPFAARAVKYVKVPLRRDAFRTTFAIGHLDFRPTEADPYLRYYCETWLTDEVPFGCLRFRTTVTVPETGEVLAKRVWTAVETGE